MEELNDIKVPKQRFVVFALTHIGKWDFEIVNEQINAVPCNEQGDLEIDEIW